jgi:phosphoenolpyruvate carboxykinase (GTP)
VRVLEWMLDRCAGNAGATESPIGRLPRPEDLNTKGLDVNADALRALLTVDPASWRKETSEMRAYMEQYGSRLPAVLLEELKTTEARLG